MSRNETIIQLTKLVFAIMMIILLADIARSLREIVALI